MSADPSSIADAAARGDGAAAQQARRWLLDNPDSEDRARLLDPLAITAATSAPALELLLWAIDELELDRGALRRLLVSDADLDEAHQDVLVAVAETIGGFRGDARFTTWLHQVARFKAIALLRRRRPDHDDTAAMHDDVPTGSPLLGDAARVSSIIASRVSVTEIIDALPTMYRDAVILRDIQHLSYDELAAELDLNLNTAKARVARGRALVAARLGER